VLEGQPYRPDVLVWLELPDDLIVGMQLVTPKAPVGFSEALANALSRPAVGLPRRPARIRVAEESLAAEIRSAASGIEIVVAPTPELDVLLDRMAKTFPAGDVPASYFENGRVSAEVARRFFEAAKLLWVLAPWKTASESHLVRVDVPAFGLSGACLSVIGALGESFGFLLFPSLEARERFAEAAAEAQRPQRRGERRRPDVGTSFMSLDYERGADLPPPLLREVIANQWPVAAPNAYPRVIHRDPDGCPRPISERDVRIVTAVAQSLASMVVKHPGLLSDQEIEPICESWVDSEDLEVRFTMPFEAWPLFDVNLLASAPERSREPRRAKKQRAKGRPRSR
jgi:hypothetical protein